MTPKKPPQQVLQIRCLRRAHILLCCPSAASIECNEDEVDLSNWNSSEDAYTFLYNPDLWQQRGNTFSAPST